MDVIKTRKGSTHHTLGLTRRTRKLAAWLVLMTYPFSAGIALADGIEGAQGSAYNPEIIESANGINIVNINRPSSGGVSRNEYDQFNVDQSGLILNNSTGIIQTQLGGYIDGNARLGGNQATIILNEVVSNNPSDLQGYMEVAGKKAEVIVANPNGITCDGCGFINTTRGILTTGTSIMQNGELQGFSIMGGGIQIIGKGINASNVSQLDLLSQAITLNSELWSDTLNVVTGRNTVDHETLQATPLDDAAASTGIALDIAELGGMYANRIHIVGTEKGFGVNAGGNILASNTFTISSQGDVVVGATVGAESTDGNADIRTASTLTNNGLIAGENLSLDAAVVNNSSLISSGQLTVDADTLNNKDRIFSDALEIRGNTLNNVGADAAIVSFGRLDVNTTERINNESGAYFYSFGDMSLQTEGSLLNNSSVIQSEGALSVQADSIVNKRTHIAIDYSDAVTGTVSGKYISKSQLPSAPGNYRDAYLSYTEVTDTPFISSEGDISLMLSNGDMSLTAKSVENNYSIISSASDLNLTIDYLSNLDVQSTEYVDRSGRYTVRTWDKCSWYETCSHKNRNTYYQNYAYHSEQTLTLGDATLSAAGTVSISSGTVVNGVEEDLSGSGFSGSSATSDTVSQQTTGQDVGSLLSSPFFSFSADSEHGYLIETDPAFTNYKNFISSDYMLSKLQMATDGTTTTRLGDGFYEQKLIQDQMLDLTGAQYLDESQDAEAQYIALMDNGINAQNDLQLSVGIALTSEQIESLNQPIVWMVEQDVETSAGVQTALVPKVYLPSAMAMDLRPDGALIKGGVVDIQAEQSLANSGAIQSSGDLSIASGGDINNEGVIKGQGVSLRAKGDINHTSTDSHTSSIEGTTVALQSGGDINVTAGRITGEQGVSLAAAGDLNIKAREEQSQALIGRAKVDTRDYAVSEITSGGDLTLSAGGDLTSEAAKLEAAENISVAATSIRFNALKKLVSTYSDSGNTETADHDETVLSNQIISGGNLVVSAAEDLLSEATEFFSENGTLALLAQGDITLAEVIENDRTTSVTTSRSERVFSSTKRTQTVTVAEQTSQGNSLTGSNVVLQSGATLSMTGADIDAEQKLKISAADDVEILAATNTTTTTVTSKKKTSSLLSNKKTTHSTHSESLVVGSNLTAGDGGISIETGGSYTQVASNLDTNSDITLSAAQINLLGASEVSRYESTTKRNKTFSDSSATTKKEQAQFVGSELSAGGNITLTSQNGMALQGAKVDAEEALKLSAKDDILITAGIEQTTESYSKTSENMARVKSKDKGYIKQSAVGSQLNAGSQLSIDSDGGDLTVAGSSLTSNGNLVLGDSQVKRDADGKAVLNEQGQYLTEDGQGMGDINVETVALQNTSWDEKSYSYKGVVKDLAKGVTFVASSMGISQTLDALGVDTSISLGEKQETRIEETVHQGSTLSADSNVILRSDGTFTLAGSDLNAGGDAYIETERTVVTAVIDQTTTRTHSETETVDAVQPDVSEQEVTLGGFVDTKESLTKTTTVETAQAAGINVGGNLTIKSQKNIDLLGSDVVVGGDADLQAESVTVAGIETTTRETETHRVEETSVSMGVKNAYVDTAYAAKAVDDARKDVKAAKDALDDAKQRIKEGTLAESALADYKANLVAADTQLAQATLNLASSGASAAATTATGGFYATGSAEVSVSEDTSESVQTQYRGSTLQVGGNASLNAKDSIDIIGSTLGVNETLALNADEIAITAGIQGDSSQSSTQSKSASTSVSVKASGDSYSGSLSANRSDSSSESQTHVNSLIQAGNLTSDSDKLTIAGAQVDIDQDVTINTGELTLASLQDTSTSSSKSSGMNAGLGLGGESLASLSSVGGNANSSRSDRAWVTEQTRLIGGGNVTITADKTEIKGAVLASATVDEQGQLTDQGNLTLITDELLVSDIQDRDKSESEGFNLNTGLSSTGSSTLGLTANGHIKEQTTYATLGNGTIQTRTGDDHDLSHTNRDLNATQEITKDQQTRGLDSSVTVDHRVATEGGRQAIKNDFVDTYEHGEDIANTLDTIGENEKLGLLNFGEALDNNAKGTQLKNDLLRNPENQHIVDGIKSGDPELYAQAMKDLGHLAQEKFGLELSDINLYDANKTDSLSLADTAVSNVKGGTVVDEGNAEYGNIFIDAGDGATKTDMANTLGHEVLESQSIQGKDGGLTNGLFGRNSAETQEALANAFGSQFAGRINQAVGGDLNSSGGENFSNNLQHSQVVHQGTQRANNVGSAKVEHRQLYLAEVDAIISSAPDYAKKKGIDEEQAKRELTRQALRIVDKKWSEQIDENPEARAMLEQIASNMGDVEEASGPRGLIDFLADETETSKPFQANDEATFNDPFINTTEAVAAEKYIVNADGLGFLSAYAVDDPSQGLKVTTSGAIRQAGRNFVEGIDDLISQGKEDPVGLIKAVGEGFYDDAKDAITHPLETFVFKDTKGEPEERQLIAELQGDVEAARNQAADSFLEAITVPGAGRVVKGAGGEVLEQAAKQARKKIDSDTAPAESQNVREVADGEFSSPDRNVIPQAEVDRIDGRASDQQGSTGGSQQEYNAGTTQDTNDVTKKVDYSSIKNPKNVAEGKEFTLRQKREALELNKAANGGVVKSDLSGTTLVKPQKSQRGVTPDPNEWQFDHKVPKSCGGTNCSSNLQILSRQENRAKSNN